MTNRSWLFVLGSSANAKDEKRRTKNRFANRISCRLQTRLSVHFCRVETQIGGQKLYLETGKIAKQAHGSVVVGLGETLTLTAACEGPPIPGRDFFPLMVDYREKTYA